MKLVRHLLISLLLALPAGRAFSQSENWQLRPAITVDSSGIFLGQLLTNTSVPLLRLAPAPQWGQTNTLTRDQIIELARAQFPAVETTNWSGPAQVRIARRGHQLLDFQLLEVLTPALQRAYGAKSDDLEIRLAQAWTPPQVPDEPLTVKVTDLPMDGLLPTSFIAFELWVGHECIGTWRLSVQAKLWREVPIARSTLTRGQLLHGADIGLERRDVLAHHETYVNLATAAADSELNENIAIGQPVLQRCIRQRPAVHRGQIVDALFQDGALKISLKVVTLEEGIVGQAIRVRNPRTNHDLVGKVENEETILITL